MKQKYKKLAEECSGLVNNLASGLEKCMFKNGEYPIHPQPKQEEECHGHAYVNNVRHCRICDEKERNQPQEILEEKIENWEELDILVRDICSADFRVKSDIRSRILKLLADQKFKLRKEVGAILEQGHGGGNWRRLAEDIKKLLD